MVRVTEPTKQGDGMNAFINYKIEKEDGTEVWRRYSDFVWLHNTVAAKHPGVILPGLPDKALVGRFSSNFIEARQARLEVYLNDLVHHPRLETNPDILHFLTHPDPIVQSAPPSSSSRGGGLFGMIRDLQASAQQSGWIGGKSDVELPIDVQGEEMKAYLTALDAQLNAVHKHASKLIQKHRDVASSYAEFGLAVNLLGNCETDTQFLAHGLSQLGSSADRLSVIQHEQADEEELKFETRIRYYIKYVASAKDAAKGRERLLHDYHNALTSLDSKENKLKKLKETNASASKVNDAERDVTEAKAEVERTRAAHEEVCEVTRLEMERFQHAKVQFFKALVMEFVKLQVEFAKKDLAVWEGLLPEVTDQGLANAQT